MEYIRYAYAMYLEKNVFDTLHGDLGNERDYAALRQEVADLCFSGDTDFSTADLVTYGSPVGRVISGHGAIDSEADSSGH